jgi:hypothetical protein
VASSKAHVPVSVRIEAEAGGRPKFRILKPSRLTFDAVLDWVNCNMTILSRENPMRKFRKPLEMNLTKNTARSSVSIRKRRTRKNI